MSSITSLNQGLPIQKHRFFPLKSLATLTAVTILATTIFLIISSSLNPPLYHPSFRGYALRPSIRPKPHFVLSMVASYPPSQRGLPNILPMEIEYPIPQPALRGAEATPLDIYPLDLWDNPSFQPIFNASYNCTLANANTLYHIRQGSQMSLIHAMKDALVWKNHCLLPVCEGSIKRKHCLELQKLTIETLVECFTDRVLFPYFPLLSHVCPSMEWEFSKKILEIGVCHSGKNSSSEIRHMAMRSLQNITSRLGDCQEVSPMEPYVKSGPYHLNDTARLKKRSEEVKAYYKTIGFGDPQKKINITSRCIYRELSINGPDFSDCTLH